jgi:hypothetical protein
MSGVGIGRHDYNILTILPACTDLQILQDPADFLRIKGFLQHSRDMRIEVVQHQYNDEG